MSFMNFAGSASLAGSAWPSAIRAWIVGIARIRASSRIEASIGRALRALISATTPPSRVGEVDGAHDRARGADPGARGRIDGELGDRQRADDGAVAHLDLRVPLLLLQQVEL
ncbi:hypothetical protein ACS0Y3_28670 [Burkholderia gladioli]|uniref:hypothetical protein n=1 Tax=Burkholderia gladioli TaxID=28095 RepID=UPI003F79D387